MTLVPHDRDVKVIMRTKAGARLDAPTGYNAAMTERAVAAAVDPEILAIARQVAGIVRGVLDDPAYRVYLFGSWVSGEAAARSDVDIGIEGPTPVSPAAMVNIREACDSLSTLRTVDIVDLGRVTPGFREGLVVRSVEPEPP